MKHFRRYWESQPERKPFSEWVQKAFYALRDAFGASFFCFCLKKANSFIRSFRPIQYILNPAVLNDDWYASAFYRRGIAGIRRTASSVPSARLPWNTFFVGLYPALMLLIPQNLWWNGILLAGFFLLALFYFSHHADCRTGVNFALVNFLLLLFWAALALAAPYSAVHTLTPLLAGIDFFFLVSFAIRTKEDLQKFLQCIYVTLFALCTIGLVQQNILCQPVCATFSDGVAFGEILVLLFPFAFLVPFSFSSAKRRIAYLALLLMMTFTLITATHSKAALMGFSTELLLLFLLIDRRYLPLLLFLGPAVTRTAAENIMQMWHRPETYGNFFSNLIYAFQDFWNNGFGVNRSSFLELYHATAKMDDKAQTLVQIPYLKISPVYFTVLLDMGAIFLLGFLRYILRLAHSTMTSLFTAPKPYRIYFAAGFATLAGISVSSMLEATMFAPRTLLLYWGMLGLIRAIRMIRFGVGE